jgi:hypothetical protein
MIEQVAYPEWLGWIVFALLVGSLFLVVLATLLGKDRKPKVALTVIVAMIALGVAVVGGMWIGGIVFSVLMG